MTAAKRTSYSSLVPHRADPLIPVLWTTVKTIAIALTVLVIAGLYTKGVIQ